jgi:hypothetical protein
MPGIDRAIFVIIVLIIPAFPLPLMDPDIQIQLELIKKLLEWNAERYTAAVQADDFDEAAKVNTAINRLQIKMDELMPYATKRSSKSE